jgi:endonuclease/exonuclease/phosphatase family metal-dependent hydrolase
MSDNLTYRALKTKYGPRIVKTLCVIAAIQSSPVWSQRIEVLSFNLQNLFDNRHDLGRADWAFLPRSLKRNPQIFEECLKVRVKKWRNECFFQDWNEKALNSKIRALARSLNSKSIGTDPDFMVFQEVENDGVLRKLQEALGRDRYPYRIHVEGPDPRGIEVAILSKWKPLYPPKLHSIHPRSRPILESSFLLEIVGSPAVPLTLLAVHLPSAGNPTSKRVQNLKLLNDLAQKISPEQIVVVAGDFNITVQEETRWKIVRSFLFPLWQVPHYTKCPECLGSFWDSSGKTWNKFDLILTRKGHASEIKTFPRVHRLSKFPEAFSPETGRGVSDHFPVSLSLAFAANSATSSSSSRKILKRETSLGLWEAIHAKLRNFRTRAIEKARNQ